MNANIDKARAFAFAEVGIQLPPTIESFASLSSDERKRVNDSMSLYIVENPSGFGDRQLEVARATVNRPSFGRDLPEIEETTFADAFGQQVKKSVEATTDVVGKGITGGISGLLSGNIVTLLAVGVAGFVAYKLVIKK